MQENESKSPLVFTLLVILVLIAAVGYYFLFSSKDTNFGVDEDTQDPIVQTSNEEDTSSGIPPESTNTPAPTSTKTFNVDGDSFSFSVNEMRVKKGDTVKIVFNNKEGFHDWVLDEFNARTKQIRAGESETIEFVASEAGTFEYYCSVGQHRAQGMVGKLIVE